LSSDSKSGSTVSPQSLSYEVRSLLKLLVSISLQKITFAKLEKENGMG
jgi:hypothetical protein